MAVSRVAERVRGGGHAVPPDDIRRRYSPGLTNFFSLYAPIADSWAMYDNSSPPARLIAMKEEGAGTVRVEQIALWQAIQDNMKIMEKEGDYEVGVEPRLMGVPISEITEILARVGREAFARHKALGHPVVIWRDGRVVIVPPEEIEL